LFELFPQGALLQTGSSLSFQSAEIAKLFRVTGDALG